MNIFELFFFVLAIVFAVSGAIYGKHWGIAASIAGAFAGLLTPFVLSQLVVMIDEIRYSKTEQGRRRAIAESLFDKSNKEKRNKSWRVRPQHGFDGSTIVTIFYGQSKPPRRAFYRFSSDSEEPQPLHGDEILKYIKPSNMR